MTQPPGPKPPTGRVARAPSLWLRAGMYVVLTIVLLWVLLVVALVVWTPIEIYRTWGSWETRRLAAGMAVGLTISMVLLLVGQRVRKRPGRRTIGDSIVFLAYAVMGVASQAVWYGTPRWHPRWAPLNLLLGLLFWCGLGVLYVFLMPRWHTRRHRAARLAVKRRELLEQIASFRARKLTRT